MSVRVRFAPSPTGNVHIGNIRVAIFNWLFARHEKGAFLLRIEDTDLERSTPEAIRTLLESMAWLGLDFDEPAVYQTKELPRHQAAVERMLAAGTASRSAGGPVTLHLDAKLFDPSFVTEPGEEASIEVGKGALQIGRRGLLLSTTGSDGQVFARPIGWDTVPHLRLAFADGTEADGAPLRRQAEAGGIAEGRDAAEEFGRPVARLVFRRRLVFFDDLVLGRLEKPLDSLRDLVIVRSDGSPVFHLANVADDVTMRITHILRGNDHVENTFRHLFLFRALGATPPKYGHFPMIVNGKGKPYSKRDGDAYVGDFRGRGFLPDCLFNFLALCGWSPGGDREILGRSEMVRDFSLARVSAAAAQFNLEKLEWMNGQILAQLPAAEVRPILAAALAAAGRSIPSSAGPGELAGDAWLDRLFAVLRDHVRTLAQFVEATGYFFADPAALDPKAVEKVLKKNDGAGLKTLAALAERLAALPEWTESAIQAALDAQAAEKGLKMGDIAQPLRVALTGGTVSRGIHETLHLVGRAASLRRIAAAAG